MFELMDTHTQNAVIKVIGVGGGGGNAVNHMVESSIEGVDFICANTDAQALKHSNVKTILQLGAGSPRVSAPAPIPEVGKESAMEDKRPHPGRPGRGRHGLHHRRHGWRTGTGAAPVVPRWRGSWDPDRGRGDQALPLRGYQTAEGGGGRDSELARMSTPSSPFPMKSCWPFSARR